MSQQEIKQAFIAQIRRTLESNGLPQKKVTLPLEKMYEVADNKGLNFNDILAELDDQGIGHEKLPDKILFFAYDPLEQDSEQESEGESELASTPRSEDQQESLYAKLFERFKDMDLSAMMRDPQSILQNMSGEDLQAIQEFYQKLSPADRDQLAKKAKDMGLF